MIEKPTVILINTSPSSYRYSSQCTEVNIVQLFMSLQNNITTQYEVLILLNKSNVTRTAQGLKD